MRVTHLKIRNFATQCVFAALLITAPVWGALRANAGGKVTACAGSIELPTYPWAAVKHPYFRGTDKVNIYPYPMLDFLSREKTNRTYRTVVLENEYLRITFLPELGGKIHEVIDKTTGQPMFYVNHVIKPGLIGQCGAWTSGGVEWNTGPQGHTVGCMQPVDVEILPAEKDGSRSVAVGETERIYGTKWTVVVTLRPGRSFIEERIRIYNPTERIRPYYFWNCTAAPNTPGFRFIYPMTLGCDHGGEKFFQWPVDHGKDLSRGTNYQDASSIFAWHCDQDFFGSYNDDLNHGAVSYANHHQLPGKKAWTWGYGGFGKMHQMDLTDNDGPYNEVQTGPLLTQAQVGRLEPCEAVEWKEWWYPVHGIGGFTFANKDVAVNASVEDGKLHLRMIGTETRSGVEVRLRSGKGRFEKQATCGLSPRDATEVTLAVSNAGEQPEVELASGNRSLAVFSVPLRLPARTQPEPKPKAETATELVQAGWQDYLFARYDEAESKFRKALEKDPREVGARTGLAFAQLDRDPVGACREARAALDADPDYGLAEFALAAGLCQESEAGALEQAWKASLDPATAVAGRALAAKILLRAGKWSEVVAALSEPGPWETDQVCRQRRALAHWRLGDKKTAVQLARANLETDPLDTLALSILWVAKSGNEAQRLRDLIAGKAQPVLELTAEFGQLKQPDLALRIIQEFYLDRVPPSARDPMAGYWAASLARQVSGGEKAIALTGPGAMAAASGVFPHRAEGAAVLRDTIQTNPNDGRATLYLGHLLFRQGREKEGRELWKRAAELKAEPVIAYRALGMAAKTLDNDLPAAREWLEKANQADATDAIVARDLANVLFALADKSDSDSEKRQLTTEARNRLKAAFESGKGRSDFVALLARAESRLGGFAETVRMLDSVRVTVWEGAHEVHDLFQQAHLALGEEHLKAGRPAEALNEFNRALEYPENLATGKLENAREAHIQYARGNALAALGRKQEARGAWKLAAEEPESKETRIEEARKKAKEALGSGQQ